MLIFWFSKNTFLNHTLIFITFYVCTFLHFYFYCQDFNMCIACTHILYAIVDLFHLWVHYVFVQFIYIILFGQELLYGWKKNIWYLQLFLFTFIHYIMLQFVNTVCCVILCVILQYIYFLCILFWLFNEITCLFWTYNFGQYSSSIYDNNDIKYINKHVFKHFMKFLIRHVNTTLTYLVKKKSRRHKRQLFFHCLL